MKQNDPNPLSDALMADRRDGRQRPELWSATSEVGMVASAHYRATEAGLAILQAGGNAFDAAIATSLALAVVEPAGSGIGGMGMATVHVGSEGQTFVLPGPCRAPRLATPEAVKASPSRYNGYRAVAVPAYLSVLDALATRYASMPTSELVRPAAELAEHGFVLTPLQASIIEQYQRGLAKSALASQFLDEDGSPRPMGTKVLQPQLGRTLRRLGEAGLRDFYDGEVAARLAEDMQAHDGFIDAADLAAVPVPQETAPLRGNFRGQEVRTAGPPAGGQALLQMLNLYTVLAEPDLNPDSPAGAELIAATIRQARLDRRTYRMARPEDPDLTSMDHAEAVGPDVRRWLGEGETSHLSVMDAKGNAVGLTQSIERSFGAKVACEELGFIYNGYLKGFKIEAKRHPHFLRPGAVARSNAAPTILLEDGRPRLVIGSTGSERMVSGIFQVLVREATQSPFEAVAAPRLHATPDGELLIEWGRFPDETRKRLAGRYSVTKTDDYAFLFGGLQLVARREGLLVGVAEPRRDGAAAGP